MSFLIDLDGTLLNNDLANLDSVEFMTELLRRQADFLIMTNSVCHPDIIINRLQNAGISVSVKSILNPIVSINSFIKSQNIKSAFIVGSDREISQICVDHEEYEPDIVLFLDFEKNNINYNRLQRIYQHTQKHIPIISASGSTFYLMGDNKQIDTGAFVAMFESLSETKIPIFGKPSENYFGEALRLLNCKASETVIIGDDWSTDILGSKKAGCKAVLVKSGKYKELDEMKGHPDLVVNRMMELFEKLDKKPF